MISCIGCMHWWFFAGHPDYSEQTPAEEWEAFCFKGHWKLEGIESRAGDWFKTMQKAQECKDYEPRPGAPERACE